MEDLIKALNPIITKISDFFDLFDLSFVVSGTISISAYTFLLYQNNSFNLDFSEIHGFLLFFYIIICYVSGIASWVIGKAIRNIFGPNYLKVKESFVKNDATSLPLFRKYESMVGKGFDMNSAMAELYGFLWVELRENSKFSNSFSLIKRYWVQTATFDGLISSFGSWALVLLLLTYKYKRIDDTLIGLGGILLFILLGILALVEARRYKSYQMREIVHTYIKVVQSETSNPITVNPR